MFPQLTATYRPNRRWRAKSRPSCELWRRARR